MDNLDHYVIGSTVVNDKEIGEYGLKNLKGLCYINMYSPKRNYLVPQYHTNQYSFSDVRTFEACKQLFPNLIQLDSGLLVNMSEVEHVEETRFGLYAHFYSGLKTEIAKNKKDLDIIKRLMK
ncbi:hypothetical protein [Paenibacillus sp. ACRRY]|uniref:hypothetical protein n=1 Tax=Paenibacillus sp. ACRRY TaxID=2918208 RepID=UPI001EF41C05|nr:hypothetical protein [Paenibacillus sp. ACRRY]MCG7385136.1 hypothetical protein [Paenibacillus sp. ACRRY]